MWRGKRSDVDQNHRNEDPEANPLKIPENQEKAKHVMLETPIHVFKESFDEDDDADVFDENEGITITAGKEKKSKIWECFAHVKSISLALVCLGFLMVWSYCEVRNEEVNHLILDEGLVTEHLVDGLPRGDRFLLKFRAEMSSIENSGSPKHFMEVWLDVLFYSKVPQNNNTILDESHLYLHSQNISTVWEVPTSKNSSIIDPTVKYEKLFRLNRFNCSAHQKCILRVNLKTNLDERLPILLSYNLNPINKGVGALYAALILLFLYVLIIFEIISKVMAAIVTASIAIGVLALLDAKPSGGEILMWVDWETVLLLYSMMIIVVMVGETGIFNYLSAMAFRVTGGKMWPLINVLCFTSAILSCLLDNVTTALLMTPVTIRLCEVMKINPVPVLTNMLIYSNIGGACTPIGDPPNIIIASNVHVVQAGVTFNTFTLHMSIGVILALIVANVQLRFVYRDPKHFHYSEPSDVHEIRQELEVWKRTAESMSSYSKQEVAVKDSIMKRTCRLGKRLDSKTRMSTASMQAMDETQVNFSQLASEYSIKDKPLLIKSTVCLTVVILGFLLQSLPLFSGLSLGGTAFLGSTVLLIICEKTDIHPIIAKIEWGTLQFFVFLFILMEALSKLGLIDWMGAKTQLVIMSLDESWRLPVAILLILWVSAIASALVDNIPLTTMMIHIATGLAENEHLKLPLQPLIWALAFGACFGGNGTILGSSSNIVCAGVSEQHGYKFSFLGFMKIGFPIMISSVLVVTVYLLIAHSLFSWH